MGAPFLRGRSYGEADGAKVRDTVSQERQERWQRCGGDLRGGRPPEHALRAHQIRAATVRLEPPPRPPGLRRGAHRNAQAHPRPDRRVRLCRAPWNRAAAPRSTGFARTTAGARCELRSRSPRACRAIAQQGARVRARDPQQPSTQRARTPCPYASRNRSHHRLGTGGDGGNGHDFRNGRQFSAWLGLVPRQYSTGGKTRLGHITKRGDPYLRTLLVMGARSVLQRAYRETDPLSRWALALQQRRGYHRACVAIAAKNARVAWALLAKGAAAA